MNRIVIYIAYLKYTVNTAIKLNIASLKRSGSVTMLPEDQNTLLSRFNMTPTNQAVERILETTWTPAPRRGVDYQLRSFSGNKRGFNTLFKQDSYGNKMVIVLTRCLLTDLSTGSYFGYRGSAEGFFTMVQGMDMNLVDFESTILHQFD